jgi:DNA-binding transcriptional LysR family regulator
MELIWLEDFVAVAKLRNFSQAALARHATQPALSRRIKALENWYGVSLFDRSTYPVLLTRAGSEFLVVAEAVIANLYRSRREARAASARRGQTIRFAVPHSLASSFFPHWWRGQPHHRHFAATVMAADFDECVEMLVGGACPFLICYEHESEPNGLRAHGVLRKQIGRDRLVPVSACDAEGRALFDLDGGTNGETPLLAYTSTSMLGRIASSQYARLEGCSNVVLRFETALVEALKTETLLGEGVAWLPASMIAAELRAGTLRVIENENFVVQLQISLYRPMAAVGAGDGDPLAQIWDGVGECGDVLPTFQSKKPRSTTLP